MKKITLLLVALAMALPLVAQQVGVQPYKDEESGRYGLVDKDGNTVANPFYTAIGSFNSHGLAWVNIGGKYDDEGNLTGGTYGYVDMTGKEVIPATFAFVGEMDEAGICWVSKGGKAFEWGKKHEESYKAAMNAQQNKDAANAALVRRNLINAETHGMVSVNGIDVIEGTYGFYNKDGKELAAPVYPKVAVNFVEERAWIYDGKKYAFLDDGGNLLTEFVYDDVASFHNGFAVVVQREKKSPNRYGFIDKSGKLAVPVVYSGVFHAFENGAAVVMKPGVGFWGLVGEDGTELTPFEYTHFVLPTEGLFLTAGRYGGMGYINNKGEEVVPMVLREASPFENGVARVKVTAEDRPLNGRGKKLTSEIAPADRLAKVATYNQWAAVAPGNPAIEQQVEYGISADYGFLPPVQKTINTDAQAQAAPTSYFGLIDKEGVALTDFNYIRIGRQHHGYYAALKEGGGAGWLNLKGEEVIPFDQYRFVGGFVADGLSIAQNNESGKWGMVDTLNREVIPFIYDDLGVRFEGDVVAAKADGKWGGLDRDNNVVIPFELPDVHMWRLLREQVYEAEGCKPLSKRDVKRFIIKQNNLAKHFNITAVIPEENWDY